MVAIYLLGILLVLIIALMIQMHHENWEKGQNWEWDDEAERIRRIAAYKWLNRHFSTPQSRIGEKLLR